jgi:hypothetical protein
MGMSGRLLFVVACCFVEGSSFLEPEEGGVCNFLHTTCYCAMGRNHAPGSSSSLLENGRGVSVVFLGQHVTVGWLCAHARWVGGAYFCGDNRLLCRKHTNKTDSAHMWSIWSSWPLSERAELLLMLCAHTARTTRTIIAAQTWFWGALDFLWWIRDQRFFAIRRL